MADWNLPATTTTYVDVLANLKDRDLDSAKLFDGVTVTNPATGMIRWSSSNSRLEKWNGSAWVALAATHAISVSGSSASCTGNAATATVLQTARTINGVSFNGAANITVADATKLPLTGGTVTGTVTVDGAIKGTAVTQSATDTAAGRLTKVGDFGVGGVAINLASSGDWDAVGGFGSGFYMGNGLANAPTTGWLIGRWECNSLGLWGRLTVSQFTSAAASGQRSWFRTLVNGTWSDWREDYTEGSTFNAATATKLATARTINGVSFDGTANITIPTSPPVPGTLSGTAIAWGTNAKWHATVSSNTTFSFSSNPDVGTTCLLHVTHTGGTITWPSSVRWPGGVAPTLSTSKTHIFMFYWDGSSYRGSFLRNYATA